MFIIFQYSRDGYKPQSYWPVAHMSYIYGNVNTIVHSPGLNMPSPLDAFLLRHGCDTVAAASHPAPPTRPHRCRTEVEQKKQSRCMVLALLRFTSGFASTSGVDGPRRLLAWLGRAEELGRIAAPSVCC
jgi:hypothetical protein